MDAKEACPALDINEIWTFLNKYYVLWGACFVLIGVFLNFFGRKMIDPATFILAFLTSTFALALILYTLFFEHERKEWVNWFVLTLCAFVGIAVGILFVKIKIGVIVIGAVAGGALGLIITNTFQVPSELAFWSIVIGSAALLALIGIKKSNFFKICTTSLIGSYMIIRGVSFYAGGYPNEFILAKELIAGEK